MKIRHSLVNGVAIPHSHRVAQFRKKKYQRSRYQFMSAQLKKRSHQNSENKLLSASHGTESFMVEALQVGFESGDTFGSSAATSRPAGSMTPDAAFGETTPISPKIQIPRASVFNNIWGIYTESGQTLQPRTSPKKFESSSYWEFKLKLENF